jgi:hypothetical protein
MNIQLLCATALLAGCAATAEPPSTAANPASPAAIAAAEAATAAPVRPPTDVAPALLPPQAQTTTFGRQAEETSTTVRVLRECRSVATELVCN